MIDFRSDRRRRRAGWRGRRRWCAGPGRRPIPRTSGCVPCRRTDALRPSGRKGCAATDRMPRARPISPAAYGLPSPTTRRPTRESAARLTAVPATTIGRWICAETTARRSDADHQAGEGRRVGQRRRQSRRSQPTGIDDHVDTDITQISEGVDEVGPHAGEDRRAAGTAEAGQEAPSMITVATRGRVWSKITSRSGRRSRCASATRSKPLPPELCPARNPANTAWCAPGIAVGEQDRARPGQRQPDRRES